MFHFSTMLWFSLVSILVGIFEIIVSKKCRNIHMFLLVLNFVKLIIAGLTTRKWIFFDKKIFFITSGFFISILCFFISVKHLNIFILTICSQFKLVATYILSNIFIKKDIKFYHIMGIIIIILTSILSQLNGFEFYKIINKHVIISILGNFSSVSAQMIFSKIQNHIEDRKAYIFTFTFNMFIFIVFYSIFKANYYEITILEYIFIIIKSLVDLYQGKLSFHLTSTERILLDIFIKFNIAFVFNFFFENKIYISDIVYFIMTYIGTIIFYIEKITKLIFRSHA